jgi:hypothetical protein
MAHETVTGESGGRSFTVDLNFDTRRYDATLRPPEGEFPFVVNANGKRYELYSDGTFAEVEDGP